jgi:peptidoglycan-associated lipoprotein
VSAAPQARLAQERPIRSERFIMRQNLAARLASRLAGAAFTITLLAACTQQPPHSKTGVPGAFGAWDDGGTAARNGDHWGSGLDAPVTPGSPREFAIKAGDTVHFATDSSELSGEARQILQAQARWLQQYSQYAITIEGHADERGTREYNIALGARRAVMVKRFLAAQGVNPARIKTTSYGKERPVAVCDDISCWTQNRRAVTVLNGGGGQPVASYQ